MIKRIFILVEGQTEETFVNEFLARYLLNFGIYTYTTRVCTRRVSGRRAYRGGVDSYGKIRRDLIRLCSDINVVAITTMFDYYAYPLDAPGYDTMPATNNCYNKVIHLEHHMGLDIPDHRFIPNLILHEFEALLFSDPKKFLYAFPNQNDKIEQLKAIKENFATPEDINNSPTSAPSKRIIELFPEYNKILHGCIIALEIDLNTIRNCCSHFNSWLTRLENL